MEPDGIASDAEPGGGPEPVTDDEARSRQERSEQDDDLRSSLAALSSLASRDLDLEQLLTKVARYAVHAIPGADGSGLTLIEESRPATLVATAPFVREVDAIQYDLMQGPCVSAAAGGRTVMSGSLGADRRWPQFGSKVARLGVHSAVSLPLVTANGVVGAMNVYAHAKHAFDDRSAELVEAFAQPAAVAVQNAAILAQALRLAERLQTAQVTRSTIDRAVGILMSRSGTDEHDALRRLRGIGEREDRKLVDVAQQIVDEAVRRARSRRST